jgi:hypothetical protein
MRRITLLLALALVTPANAWDGFKLFEEPTTGPTSGGGGIWGTGAKRDSGITCAHCHVKPVGKVYASIEFFPLLNQVGPNSLYRPGQKYQMKVMMIGESLGRTFAVCAPGKTSMNGFAATFETLGGVKAGRLESDSGQDSNACPVTVADLQTGTTVTFGKCAVIANTNVEDQATWTFTWTAPLKGAGTVMMFYGVVDGNCDMKSTGDDVKMGSVLMAEGQP